MRHTIPGIDINELLQEGIQEHFRQKRAAHRRKVLLIASGFLIGVGLGYIYDCAGVWL